MKKSIIIIFSLLFFSNAFCQDGVLESLEFAKKLSKETSEYIVSGDFATAADYIEPFWPMPKSEFERFEAQATKSFKSISEGLGKSLSTVKIKEQNLGGIVFREIYFIQYEQSPLRIEYIYYKKENGWVIENIQWGSDFEKEFD